ncbi:MAG: hypothetical protein ACO23C_03775 [Prochlorococcaceae cyanobacterium]
MESTFIQQLCDALNHQSVQSETELMLASTLCRAHLLSFWVFLLSESALALGRAAAALIPAKTPTSC